MRAVAALALWALLLACGRDVPASEIGGRAFSDRRVSTSPLNVFSCSTCHALSASEDRLDPGYPLGGAAFRESFWGGYQLELLGAMNYCITELMGGAPLLAEDVRARGLFELFAGDGSATRGALPLTVVKDATALSGNAELADAERGADIYARACARCHGAPHTGQGRLTERAGIVPTDTLREFPNQPRAAVVEKVRHGKFFGLGGVMPLYSVEALSDEELADVLRYLGL